jgi:hypothetical protein
VITQYANVRTVYVTLVIVLRKSLVAVMSKG